MTDREKREQRRRWQKNSRKYLNKLQEQNKLQSILLEKSPPASETEEILNMADPTVRDPLNGNRRTTRKYTKGSQMSKTDTRYFKYHKKIVI